MRKPKVKPPKKLNDKDVKNVDPRIWSKRTEVDFNTESECAKCKKKIYFNTPYVSGKWEGWTTDHIECGPSYRQFICAIKDSKFLDVLNNLFTKLNEPKKKKAQRKLKVVK